MYSIWTIEVYPRVAAQQLTFYTYMFVCYAVILKVMMGRPFERVTNVASVGLFFSVMPPIVHAYFFGDDDRMTVYFQSFTWTLFESEQATAESVILWGLIASTAFFVGYMTRSFLRGLLAGLASYGVIILLTIGVLQVIGLREQANANFFFGFNIGTSTHQNLWLSSAQALVPFALYLGIAWRRLWPSIKRLNHALPHVALCFCGAAWVDNFGIHLAFYAALVVLVFFVLLVQNDYFDRKEDELAGRPEAANRDDVMWVTFLFLNVVLAWFTAFPWLMMLLVAILLLGLLYHHPAIRLKTRFCFSYMVEGGWAALAFAVGVATNDGVRQSADVSGVIFWIFWGGALLSMMKDWKDVEADQQAGIWTMYVTLSRRWTIAQVHNVIVACIAAGLLGFAFYNLLLGGPVGAGITLLGVALFAWVALNWENRRHSVEASMYAYAIALAGVAYSFYEAGSPGAGVIPTM